MMPIFATALLLGVGGFVGVWGARRYDSPEIPRFAGLAAAGLAATLAMVFVPEPQPIVPLVWTLLLVVLLASIAAIDAATRMIPDVLCLALIGAGLIQFPFLPNALIAAALVGLALLQTRLTQDAWLGEGDLFLLAGIVTWVGPLRLFDVGLIAALIITTQIIIFRAKSQPLAPALGIGCLAVWIGGPIF